MFVHERERDEAKTSKSIREKENRGCGVSVTNVVCPPAMLRSLARCHLSRHGNAQLHCSVLCYTCLCAAIEMDIVVLLWGNMYEYSAAHIAVSHSKCGSSASAHIED